MADGYGAHGYGVSNIHLHSAKREPLGCLKLCHACQQPLLMSLSFVIKVHRIRSSECHVPWMPPNVLNSCNVFLSHAI